MESKVCTSCFEDKPFSAYKKNSGLNSLRAQCNKCLQNKVKVPPKVRVEKEGYKICKQCKVEKLFEEFSKQSRGYGGVVTTCKKCQSKSGRIREYKVCSNCCSKKTKGNFKKSETVCNACIKKESCVEEEPPQTIKCKSCLETKNLCDFLKDKSKKWGYRGTCRLCKRNEYYYKNDRPLPEKEIFEEGYKRCSRCAIIKPFEEYTKDNGKLRSECKVCKKEYNKRAKDIINASQRKYTNERKSKDPLYKLGYTIRGLIIQSFRKVNARKNSRSVEILGCSILDFQKHIERQFLSWMSWENHGNCEFNDYDCKWHLDHIIPINTAKTEAEIYLLNHWSNFQPMCGKRNIEKKNAIFPCSNLELGIRVNYKKELKEFINQSL